MFITPNKTRYYQTCKAVNLVEMDDLSQETGFVRFNIVTSYHSDKLVTATHAIFRFESKEAAELTDDMLSLFYSNNLTDYYGTV